MPIQQTDVCWQSSTSIYSELLWLGLRVCPNDDCRAFVMVTGYDDVLIGSLPHATIQINTNDLPEEIQNSLREAVNCYGAGCYRAAALMVRRVLEELCKDKEAKGRDLYERLNKLSEMITISKPLLDAMHELRILGNDAAHVESRDYDAMSGPEIEAAIDLAKELLKAVYQQQSLVERLKAFKKSNKIQSE